MLRILSELNDAIIEVFAKHPDPNVRYGTAEALGKISDPFRSAALIRELAKDPNWEVRRITELVTGEI